MNARLEDHTLYAAEVAKTSRPYLDWIFQDADQLPTEDWPLLAEHDSPILESEIRLAGQEPELKTKGTSPYLDELMQLSLDLDQMHDLGIKARKLISKLCGMESQLEENLEFQPSPIPILENSPEMGQGNWSSDFDNDQNAA